MLPRRKPGHSVSDARSRADACGSPPTAPRKLLCIDAGSWPPCGHAVLFKGGSPRTLLLLDMADTCFGRDRCGLISCSPGSALTSANRNAATAARESLLATVVACSERYMSVSEPRRDATPEVRREFRSREFRIELRRETARPSVLEPRRVPLGNNVSIDPRRDIEPFCVSATEARRSLHAVGTGLAVPLLSVPASADPSAAAIGRGVSSFDASDGHRRIMFTAGFPCEVERVQASSHSPSVSNVLCSSAAACDAPAASEL